MTWRDGLLPLVPANTVAFSPRCDFVMHPTHWLICAQVVARPADDEPQLEAGTFEDGEAQDPGVAEAPSQRLRGRRPLRGVRPAALAPPSPPRPRTMTPPRRQRQYDTRPVLSVWAVCFYLKVKV